jgi:hypothetical protein
MRMISPMRLSVYLRFFSAGGQSLVQMRRRQSVELDADEAVCHPRRAPLQALLAEGGELAVVVEPEQAMDQGGPVHCQNSPSKGKDPKSRVGSRES